MIETRELTKIFGKTTAVDRLSIQVGAGSIFGIVGPNGAGKTTLMRMLATLLPPTSGDALVGGASIRRHAARVRRLVGYLPDASGVYPDMTVAEYMSFFAACYGVPASDRAALIGDLLTLVDLSHRRDEPMEKLSPGMRRRLGLARALVHDPHVLLLDDATAGLDPRARVELRELLKELRSMNKTIVLTSHILAELEDMCTHIAILERGRILVAGESAVIRARLRPHRIIAVRFFGNVEMAVNQARTGQGVVDAQLVPTHGQAMREESATGMSEFANGEDGMGTGMLHALKEMQIVFAGDYSDATELLRHLMRTGVQVVSFSEQADSLEKILTGLNGPAQPGPARTG